MITTTYSTSTAGHDVTSSLKTSLCTFQYHTTTGRCILRRITGSSVKIQNWAKHRNSYVYKVMIIWEEEGGKALNFVSAMQLKNRHIKTCELTDECKMKELNEKRRKRREQNGQTIDRWCLLLCRLSW